MGIDPFTGILYKYNSSEIFFFLRKKSLCDLLNGKIYFLYQRNTGYNPLPQKKVVFSLKKLVVNHTDQKDYKKK